jgi:hypothetical protein
LSDTQISTHGPSRHFARAQPGVAQVAVYYEDRTATITYDVAKADVNRLTSATTQAGYPSTPKADPMLLRGAAAVRPQIG